MNMESKMNGVSKGILGFGLAAATACGALADDLSPVNITVQGSAPQVCSLDGWSKISGPGSFSGGTGAVVTYGNADLVDSGAFSVLGPGSAIVLRAPLLCNTSITWSVTNLKGALRLDSSVIPPAGFSNQWLYNLTSGPRTTGGSAVGSLESYDSDGTPFDGESHTLSAANSVRIAYFGMIFTPYPQSARMLAGSYSESVTLTVSPSL
jgi:hypothetical protein